MPLYEYECRKCGRLFDARHGISESEDGIECPTCGARDPKRLLSTFSTGPSGSNCSPGGFS